MAKGRKKQSQGRKYFRLLLFIILVIIAIYLFKTGQLKFADFGYPELDEIFATNKPSSTTTTVVGVPQGHPGFPSNPSNCNIIQHTHYALCYNERYEQPNWVMYRLTENQLTGERVERSDDFRSDPKVSTGSAALDDYRGSGYDRGHLLPAADMRFSEAAMSETFFMSNMSPQAPRFNRGIWKKLEEQVRDWAFDNDELYVVTGPVLQGDLPTIGENAVAVPQYYYKVILDLKEPQVKGIGFIMENKKLRGSLAHYAVSIDKVEDFTGLDFFPTLPDDLEENIERAMVVAEWLVK